MPSLKGYAAVRRKTGISCVLILLAALCAAPAWSAEPQQTLTLVPERVRAPDLVLEAVEGANLRLSELRGKVVVVNFWASWCPPCRREMPALERLNQLMRGQPFAVVGINAGEEVEDVFGFRGTVNPAPSFRLLLDREGKALKAFGVSGLPTTLVLDRDGRIAYKALGARKFDDPAIVAILRALIASP